jgi:hypothetical protein
MQQDDRDAQIRRLEAAMDAIAQEARLAGMALCQNELLIRLENIARIAENAGPRAGSPPD